VFRSADVARLAAGLGALAVVTFIYAQPLQVSASKTSWNAPASNDVSTITFKQPIGATDPLRTGTYSKTLTFTLATTEP